MSRCDALQTHVSRAEVQKKECQPKLGLQVGLDNAVKQLRCLPFNWQGDDGLGCGVRRPVGLRNLGNVRHRPIGRHIRIHWPLLVAPNISKARMISSVSWRSITMRLCFVPAGFPLYLLRASLEVGKTLFAFVCNIWHSFPLIKIQNCRT